MREPFELFEPTGPETPVVVEVPHAGLELPAAFLELMVAPARALGRDADLYVDALYEDACAEGATVLVARTSRYVVDVNRGEADVDAEVVEGGRPDVMMHHGVVWRTTSEGEAALSRRLTRTELEERLNLIWRPYHRTLTEVIQRKLDRFGIAVVLAAHSMPSVERPGAREHWGKSRKTHENGPKHSGALESGGASRAPTGDPRTRLRADVVPGTRGRRSAHARFIDAVESHAVACRWTVRHDDPYAGGFTTQHYGRPAAAVHVVQVELARRLYLDESTLRPNAAFGSVRAWCRELVALLGRLSSETNRGTAPAPPPPT